MTDVVLIGGGGHCRSVIDAIESTSSFRIVGVIDNRESMGSDLFGYEIIGGDQDIPRIGKTVKNFVIAIGQIKTSAARRRVCAIVRSELFKLPNIVASTAHISKYAQLGSGIVVHHNVVINANAKIGDCCIINTGAIIEHDTTIEDFCHVSTNSTINGNCHIGADSFIGSGSTINNNVSIVGNCVIGSGAIVIRSIKTPNTYSGVVK